MNFKNKNTFYFVLLFTGAGILFFREQMEGEVQLIVSLIAIVLLMFGLYKVTSAQLSNKSKNYDSEEYFNRERYDQQEEE